MYKLTVSVYNT